MAHAAKKIVFWLALFAVTVLSLLPAPYLPPQAMSIWDKAQHALGFAGLMVLGLWAYPLNPYRAWVLLLLAGAGIELAQAATGWRQGDVLDWLADALGALLVLLVWRSLCAHRRPPHR